ncbi:MAG TPA: DUF481 domain-containing protein [Longimicrobiales bacterium]|jgi:hypothetical protein
MMAARCAVSVTLLAALTVGLPRPVVGQVAPPDAWSFKGEFSSVLSQGNAESFTLGLGASLRGAWEGAILKIETGMVRTESGKTTRRAVGTEEDFVLQEETVREKTAEAFFARARYDRSLSDRFFLFGGVDWLRNTFAGVDSRFLVAMGGGNTWADGESLRFKTDYAATFTFQHDVIENPFLKRNFPGVRVGFEAWRRLSGSAEMESGAVADWNLDETEDVRVDWTTSLSVSINRSLALKPSLQLLWRNRPSLAEVELFTPSGTSTGDRVTVPLGKLDSFFRVALVVTL